MVANIRIIAFWDMALCSLIEVDEHFNGSYCLQDENALLMKQYTPLKCQSSSLRLHGNIAKKSLIVTFL
jgi:hypothetical protein